MAVNDIIKKKPVEMTDAELEQVMTWGWNRDTGPAGWTAFETCFEEYQKRDKKKAEAFMRELPEE